MEPFQDPNKLDQYKARLGFDNTMVNCTGKIWLFWNNGWVGSVLQDSTQQITMKFCMATKTFYITLVYARCTALERLELWQELESLNYRNCPWMIGGDFNVVLNEEEKLGGLQFSQLEAMDFAQSISACALLEVSFTNSRYTWWDGRINEDSIFERLHRVLVNSVFGGLPWH